MFSGDLNMMMFFGLSIFFWLANRLVSSYKIWGLSSLAGIEFAEDGRQDHGEDFKVTAERSRKWRVLRTLFAVEIFEILYLSHTFGLHGKSAPQRICDFTTAVFEAAPEVQSLFLYKCIGFLCLSQFVCTVSMFRLFCN